MVALSFVRLAIPIVELVHEVMGSGRPAGVPVVAKLEKPEAIDNLESRLCWHSMP